MRALIITFGTRGDVEPYLALAERLQGEGHEAVLCAPEAYRSEAARSGIGFAPAATRMHELVRDGMSTAAGPMDVARAARQMTAAMRDSLVEQWDAAQRVEPTIILSHPKALGGLHIAERLAIPFAASLPLPFLTPTGEFPIPFMTGRHSERWNRTTYQFNRFTAIAYGGMINRFRRRQLGLARESRFSDFLHRDGAAVPVLYPVSPAVVPRPHDYPESAHLTGYWFRARGTAEALPDDVLAFLDGDEPVVYAGFGSMGFGRHAADRGRTVLDAVRAAGARAIVARGWGGLEAEQAEDLLVVDEVPHELLFPRVSAVMHHGGSGTTAAGLRAGRPTLICPVLGDQPFWGERVRALGVGPEPLPLMKMRADSLTERLTDLVGNAAYSEHAAAIGEQISGEDGTGRAVRILEEIEAA
ncbi:glycosyltransferase [Microbacterium sp. AK031]|uniref:glycosyltransferase n=1 Tax=Microbacterium sp. AK031 TaxID=2723076 RepID=UPI00216A2C56|nr:glycosyltransferase [Microbacterium sp. AK031]MCS3843347.1 sterol 3beta-glucosyltransferase [Microbacterium sp. AK031]